MKLENNVLIDDAGGEGRRSGHMLGATIYGSFSRK